MPNIADELSDLAISRALIIQRVANGLSKQVADQYTAIIDDIIKQLKTNDTVDIKNMNKIIKELKTRVETNLTINDDLTQLATSEATWAASSINGAVGITIASKLPSEATINKIVNTSLMEGATIANWFQSLDKSMQTDLERSIKLGVTIGETTPQIAKRVRDKLLVSRGHAESITRTAVATISNEARMKTYKENDDIIKGYEHVATLDSRTSSICATRDGAFWSKDGKGLNDKGKKFQYRKPPLHFRCRSVLLPITKSFKELGLDIDEVPAGTRATMDGQVSSGTTFEQWLSNKDANFQKEYLGKGRYELYKKGIITFNDLVNQAGRELSISELLMLN